MGDSVLISVDQMLMDSWSLTEPSSMLDVKFKWGSGFSLGCCVCWPWF